MKILLSLKSLIKVLPQIFIFILFWTELLNASRSFIFVILGSMILILIVKDFLLGLISIVLGIGLSALVVKLDTFFHFFINKDVHRIYFLVIITILIAAISLKLCISSDNPDSVGKYLNYNFVVSFYLLISFLLFNLINRQTKINAMRYLVSTGEDNAAWLYGMSGGITTNEEIFDIESSSSYSGTATAVISTAIRGIQKFENNSYVVTDNILNVQRIFAICMAIGVVMVALSAYRYAIKINFSFTDSFAISLLAGLVTYLGFTSFALFGHLTPSESLLFLFSFMALLTFKEKANIKSIKLKSFRLHAIALILFFAASEAWWPLAPAMYLSATLIFVNFFMSFVKSNQRYKILVSTGLLLFLATLVFNVEILNLIRNSFEEFTKRLHIAGGTMSLGLVHIILIVGTLICVISIKKFDIFSARQSFILKAFLFSLFFYYFITIFLSQAIPPFNVSYAGFKLGLFTGVAVLPISILLIASHLKKKFQFKYLGVIFSMGAFLIFTNAGPPTSPNNPAWNQMGFPYGLINAIDNDPNGGWVWIKPMVDAIDNSDGRRVLCYQSNQNSIDPFQLHICHRFVTSLQGFETEPLVGLWYQVLDNAITKEEFANLAPTDFFETYQVIDLSEYAPKTESISLNYIYNFLESD